MPALKLPMLVLAALLALLPQSLAAEDAKSRHTVQSLRRALGQDNPLLEGSEKDSPAKRGNRTRRASPRRQAPEDEGRIFGDGSVEGKTGGPSAGKSAASEAERKNEQLPKIDPAMRQAAFLPPKNIVIPKENRSTLAQIWSRRASFLEARDLERASEQEEELARVQAALALENLLTPAAALMQEAHAFLQNDRPAEALKRCELASQLAPSLAGPQLCAAQANLAQGWKGVLPALGSLRKAGVLAWNDVLSRGLVLADGLFAGLMAALIACFLVLLVLVLRSAPMALHDLNHLFPKGTPAWLSTLLVLMVLALPVLFGVGVLQLLMVVAAASTLLVRRSEAVLVGVVIALLLAGQFLFVVALRSAAVGELARDVYLLERGDSPESSLKRLADRLERGEAEYSVAFALGRHYKRFGRYELASQAYERARSLKETPELLNNLGSLRFLQGESSEAIALFEEAASRGGLAASYFNLAKIHFREGRLEYGQKAQQQALAIDGERIRKHGFEDDLRANLFLMDEALSDELIAELSGPEAGKITWMMSAGIPVISGRLPPSASLGLPVAMLLLVFAGQLLQRRIRASIPCEICGRPVCSRCDPERGAATETCSQCVSVFIRRSGVDARQRERKEESVRKHRRRHRWLTTALALVLVGGGHLYVGRVWLGASLLALSSSLLTLIYMRGALIRSSIPITSEFSSLLLWAVAGAVAVLWLFSLVNLLRNEEF